MTLEEIKKRVEYIREIKGDDESAHSHEDKLYEDFIRFCETPGDALANVPLMAQEVLKTKEIDFARWCA